MPRAHKFALTLLLLAGWGPFTCRDGRVDEANTLTQRGDGAAAVEVLKPVDVDQPEVHLSRAMAHLIDNKPDEARSSLDQAYRLVAEVLADGDEKTPERLAHLNDLKRRIAFARGEAGVAKEDWKAAYEEYANVVRLDPSDDAARWNLELAWFKLHPPCNLRDDDHEPDDPRADAKPYDPQKATGRLLCPADEDWYAVQAPAGALLYGQLEGKVDTADGEKRDVTLELHPPDGGEAVAAAALKDGKASVGVPGLPTGGAWVFRVAGPGRAEMTYSLKVELVPPCPADDDAEENDEPIGATVVQDGERPGLKSCPGDADWFRVTVPSGEAREVVVQHDPARGRLAAALFDPTGEAPVAAASESAGGTGITIPKGDGEQVFLVQVTAAEARENLYTLVVKKPEDENQGDENKDEDKNEQDQKKDQENQEDQKKDEQEKQDPQAQKPPPSENVDIEKLVEALDEHPRNPQLEKALRALPAHPQLEDY